MQKAFADRLKNLVFGSLAAISSMLQNIRMEKIKEQASEARKISFDLEKNVEEVLAASKANELYQSKFMLGSPFSRPSILKNQTTRGKD
jgi:hypothetical protein